MHPIEVPAESDHGAEDILGDARLVPMNLGKRRAGRHRGAVNPVQPGARNLDEPEPHGRRSHLAGEDEGDEDVDLREHIAHVPLVGVDEVTGYGEMRTHPIREAR